MAVTKLTDNKYGFDIRKDNPFQIFRILREIAIESVGEDAVIDVSRGDPGYGFCPSVGGRELYAFLVELDIFFNNAATHFVRDNTKTFDELWKDIMDHGKKIYEGNKAERVLENLFFFISRIEKFSKNQKLNWDKQAILFEIFKYSSITGGCYHNPQGETLTRVVVAAHHNTEYGIDVDHNDIILMQGVSHGIGTLFKTLNAPTVGYLNEGDSVMLLSPSYAPYSAIIKNRGMHVYAININPQTGEVEGDLDAFLENAPSTLKMICIIDPNNPTGFILKEAFLKKIAAFAKKRDILIASDEVYSDFFFERTASMLNHAPERTIAITGRSKIERSTGLRFGEYIIDKVGQKYIANTLLKKQLNGEPNLMQLLIAAKGPGGIDGEFRHTTFVTGPSQFLGICHMLLGQEDRLHYLKRIRVNMENFYSGLGKTYNKNLYYANFNLAELGNTKKVQSKDPEEIFCNIAKRGIVLIPSYLFVAEANRTDDHLLYARASIPNISLSQVQKASSEIKNYINTL